MLANHSPTGLILLSKDSPARITKTNAYCVQILIPTRPRFVQVNGGNIIVGETPEHWERLTCDGNVVRCHTEYEAQMALGILGEYIEDGQFKSLMYTPYSPTRDDLPFHDWIRGARDRRLNQLGLTAADLPESHDPSLAKLSDDEWIARGPR